MIISSAKIKKEIFVDNSHIRKSVLTNLITGRELTCNGYEFVISYTIPSKLFSKKASFTSSDMTIVEAEDEHYALEYSDAGIDWQIKLIYCQDEASGAIKKNLEISCSNPNVIINYVDMDSFDVSGIERQWTIPLPKKRILIPSYIATTGQPYYVQDMFFGTEFPTADNRIVDGQTHARYYLGRAFKDIARGGVYVTTTFVMGSGIGVEFNEMRTSFFQYVSSFSRPARFRVQFNSWYDHMLDITSDKVKKSFSEVGEGFAKAGFRPLDCYVIDDGWTDYKRPAFWEFDKASFDNEFYNESELTKSLGSTFGVWFGPRGGYTTQTVKYARFLTKLGYPNCRQSFDICTANPRYIKDLCNRMADFCTKYNVSYFKIDGFAITPCKSSRHGHPKGKGDGIEFYTFLWEEWIKGFEHIRSVQPDVFLNITSYAHCSPWFLKWCDAVWINNCGDMGYEGKGTSLNRCLNYRDSAYKDFFDVRQLQFPTAYIYNHEPCYAERNYDPPLPNPSHKTVVYTYEEFEKYMYFCMMRGTGFVEVYFSPSMFDDKRWAIAAKTLSWAEENFSVLRNAEFFGDNPTEGGIYGYYAFDGKRAIMSIRNSDDAPHTYTHINAKRCHKDNAYTITQYYPTAQFSAEVAKGENFEIELQPFEAKIFYITLKD